VARAPTLIAADVVTSGRWRGQGDVRQRRFEILLPVAFNDGRLVAQACARCVPDSLSDVVDRFGAVTYRPQPVMGSWTFGGRRYDDDLTLLSVDVDDTTEHQEWITHLKAHLLERFEQLEVYVTSYVIDVH
jgi:hypothetical protein